jgi:hypothetical protein
VSEQERFTAAAQAKSAGVRNSAPLSRHDAAHKHYLGAAQHETARTRTAAGRATRPAWRRTGWDDWVPWSARHPAPATEAVGLDVEPAPRAATRADVVVVGVDGSEHAAGTTPSLPPTFQP